MIQESGLYSSSPFRSIDPKHSSTSTIAELVSVLLLDGCQMLTRTFVCGNTCKVANLQPVMSQM